MTYKLNKTLTKVVFVVGEVAVAGSIAYFTGRAEFLFLIPILEGVLDWLKHKDN